MKDDDGNLVFAPVDGKDIREMVAALMQKGNRYSRRILKFFRWFCKYVPVFLMLFHIAGVMELDRHPNKAFVADGQGALCHCFVYFMMYVLPLVILLASRFFFLCWIFRIPFFYLFGVNAIHIAYGSIFTTDDMVMPHYCIMVMTAVFYAYGLTEHFYNNTALGRRMFS